MLAKEPKLARKAGLKYSRPCKQYESIATLRSHGMFLQKEISVKFGQLFWTPQKSIWILYCLPCLFLLIWEQEAAGGHWSHKFWDLGAPSWPLEQLLGRARFSWRPVQSVASLPLSLAPSLSTQGALASLFLCGICLARGSGGSQYSSALSSVTASLRPD